MGESQDRRYSRQLVLPGWGTEAQQKLKESIVLIIGCGGLGSHSAMALAAAGVGTLLLTDPDTIQPENLHRQYWFSPDDTGKPKTEVIRDKIRQLNPETRVLIQSAWWSPEMKWEEGLTPHLVVDGTDTFFAKTQINQYARSLNIPWVYGSVLGYRAEVAVFHPQTGTCYQCLYPDPGAELTSCALAGVVGPLPAMVANRQALESLAILSGAYAGKENQVWYFDLLSGKEGFLVMERDPDCSGVCRFGPTLSDNPVTTSGNWEFNRFLEAFRRQPEEWTLLDIRSDAFLRPETPEILPMDITAVETFLKGRDVRKNVLLICATGKNSDALMRRLVQSPLPVSVFSLRGGFESGFRISDYLESL